MLSITLKQLEIFITVAETNSFSKAGKILAFSQSTISSNIALLEETVGAELFARNNKKNVQLTEEGRNFYARAKEAVSSCYLLQDGVQGNASGSTISIGAQHIPARYILPDILTLYRKECPSARFFLQEGDDSEVLDLLNLRQVHLCFTAQKEIPADHKAKNLYNDNVVLGLPNLPRYYQTFRTGVDVRKLLTKEVFVWNQELDPQIRAYLEHIGLEKEDLNIIAEMSSNQLTKNAVIEGLGISILSRISLKCAIKSADILAIDLPGAPICPIQIVSKSKVPLNPAERDFLQYLTSNKIDFDKCNH